MYNHIGSQLSFKCWCFFNKSASTIVIKGMWYWYWPVRLIHCDGYVTWKWQLIITCQARSYRHVSQQTINMYTVQINTIQPCAQMQVYQFKCLKVFWHSLAPHSLLIFFITRTHVPSTNENGLCVSITILASVLNKNPNLLRQLGCVIWGNIILWKCLSAVCKK